MGDWREKSFPSSRVPPISGTRSILQLQRILGGQIYWNKSPSFHCCKETESWDYVEISNDIEAIFILYIFLFRSVIKLRTSINFTSKRTITEENSFIKFSFWLYSRLTTNQIVDISKIVLSSNERGFYRINCLGKKITVS